MSLTYVCFGGREGCPVSKKKTKKAGEDGIASKSVSSKTTRRYPQIDLYLGQGNGGGGPS